MSVERKILRLWYCVNTHPKTEKETAARIQASLGLETWVPTYEHQNKTGPSQRPVFPSYVFVKFNQKHDFWEGIWTTEGVKKLFSCGPWNPTAIPARAMATLRAELTLMGSEIPPALAQPIPFAEGAALTVLEGPFTSFTGICKMTAEGRVHTLLSLFGRDCTVEFLPHQVALASQGVPA